MSNFSKLLLKFGVLIILINVVGLWSYLYLEHRNIVKLQELTNQPDRASVNQEKSPSNIEDRLKNIEEKQDEFGEKLDTLESSVSANAKKATTTSTVRTSSTTSSKKQKEYTIYLGEGSTTNREWNSVQSTTISLDTNKYSNISEVYFESALSIIGGEAQARLIDAESGAIISSSSLMHNTNTPTWKSLKVNLERGSHLYVVQLRTSSGEQAILSGARLRILAE